MAAALPIISLVLGGVSTGLGVLSSFQQSAAQRAAAEQEGQIAERNRILADQDRQQAIRTADIEAADKRRENLRHMASLRAAYGASGLELAGSPLDTLADTSNEMALDERRISYEGQVRGREAAVRMIGYSDQAGAAKMKAESSVTAGYLNAGSSLIGGASNTIDKYLKLKKD